MNVRAVDLFCGAGGTSTGLYQACIETGRKLDLLAINHWPVAIETHQINHPGARHICARLESIRPEDLVPSGYLNILVASPECTHYSVARGGRPMCDQLRSSAWLLLRWLEALRVDNILIENVQEFRNWGPIGANGKPLKRHKGETYQAFLEALRSFGYNVEDRVLNAADYGDPTARRRLFIIARRGNKKISWPDPTHGESDMFSDREAYRTAREIIDWNLPGKSIFSRRKPLAKSTINRIAAGLKKYGGENDEPFLIMLYGSNKARSIDRPVPTVTATGQHIGLCEPFIVQYNGTSESHSINEPLATVTTRDRFGLVEVSGRYQIDIRFRMLQPHELAAAMSFENYKFAGNRCEQIKQIGNAVPVRISKALCKELLK